MPAGTELTTPGVTEVDFFEPVVGTPRATAEGVNGVLKGCAAAVDVVAFLVS